MGLLDRYDTIHLAGNSIQLHPEARFNEEVWDGQFHIFESRPSMDGKGYMVNTFSCPIYRDGEIIYILTATYRSSLLTDRLNFSSLEGQADTFLVDKEGNVVIYPHHYQDEEYNALMQYINDTPSIIPDGDQYFTYDGERYYTHSEALGINDWHLMTCARESAVFADARSIMMTIYISVAILWLILFFATGFIFYSMRRTRIRRTRETFYDDLLGIGNENALAVCFRKLPKADLATMYLVVFNIDRFKEFNYIYSDDNGDNLLKYIVKVFREEAPDILLFRYKSDYFVTLDPSPDQAALETTIKRIHARFTQDIRDGRIWTFDTSSGIRKIDPDLSLRRLLSDAVIALDTVRGNHLTQRAFYDDTFRQKQINFMEIESAFPSALRNHEFQAYYQPKYDMRTGAIVGAEALVRWVKPDGRIISPAEFIPCFEASHQIILLDEEILVTVCRHMIEMQEAGIEIKPVSVNLSRIHLRHQETLSRLVRIIRDSGIDPALLSFEITESALLEDNIPLGYIISSLHDLGCKVAIDDYGVGASSPDALLSNQFDILKLDKSLVDCIGNERAEDLIRSNAYMAQKWGLEVLAEGVEYQEQAERLIELGCSFAQGFHYSRPVSVEEYRALLLSSTDSRPTMPVFARSFSEDARILLDGYSLPTYIIDPKTFVVMYCNKMMCSYVGSDPTGGLCYQKLRGKDRPCEDCPAMWLYHDEPVPPKEVLGTDGRWVMLLTSYLHWQGRDYIQISRMDITRQKKMEEEIHLRSKEYEVAVQQNITGVLRYDIATDTATLNVDQSLNRVDEYTIENCVKTTRENHMIEPGSLPAASAMMKDISDGQPSRGYDIQLILPHGVMRWCRFNYSLIYDNDGMPSRAVISFFDNTEHHEKSMEYQNWNANLSALMDEHTIYIGANLSQNLVEAENRFGSWVPSSTGQPLGTFMDKVVCEWIDQDYLDEFRSFLSRDRLLGMYYSGQQEDMLEYRATVERRSQWFRVSVQMAADPLTNDVKSSFVFHNVDAEVAERERLKNEAERDSMTGLYNRATTERLIQEVLAQHTGERCCFLVIDLDDLREINSSLGHPEGDKALKAIAETMLGKFRKDDILGRIGGDEFVAFMRDVPEADRLQNAVFDFMCRIRKIHIGQLNERGIHVSIGGSFGIAGRDRFKTLYEQADLALYYTKATGKNAFHFYDPEMENRNVLYQPQTVSDWHDSIEIKRMVKAMTAFFPLVISVDLTRNSYQMIECKPFVAEQAPEEGVFDQLIEMGVATFHPEDRASFLECFHRENLLRAYADGKRIVGHRGRQLNADNEYLMVQTVVLFLEERISGDICEITFAHVVNTPIE